MTRPMPVSPGPKRAISQKLVRAPFDGELGVRRVEIGQYPHRGHPDRVVDRSVGTLCNFTTTEKDSAKTQGRADCSHCGRRLFRPQSLRERSPRSSRRSAPTRATFAFRPRSPTPTAILKPGMFATTTVVLPDKPAVVTVPETSVDYTLYGDLVFLITEKKADDGNPSSLTAVRTFVRAGDRINGRAVITSGLKPGRSGCGGSDSSSCNPVPPSQSRPIRCRRYRRPRRAANLFRLCGTPPASLSPAKRSTSGALRNVYHRYLHQAPRCRSSLAR